MFQKQKISNFYLFLTNLKHIQKQFVQQKKNASIEKMSAFFRGKLLQQKYFSLLNLKRTSENQQKKTSAKRFWSFLETKYH